jgi:phosphoglycolate phosphatase
MKRLVLFDIDGTLLHGGKLWRECLESAFVACMPGVPLRTVAYSGKTDPLICREMLLDAGLSPEEQERMTPRILEEYLERVRKAISDGRSSEVQILPGVRESLEAISSEPRVRLGLLTGNVRQGAQLKLSTVGLEHFFGIGVYGDDHWDRYELPRIAVQRAHEELGIRFAGKEVVIIGDTSHDVNCGKSLGVRTIAVATGRADLRQELVDSRPDFLFETLEKPSGLLEAILAEV